MRTYDKRIAFLVSYQTLIPHGGIGQFTKSFCELMDEYNIKVDIITDKIPSDNEFVNSLNANVIYPDNSLSYATHNSLFSHKDTFCYERMLNFRNSLAKALNTNMYNAVICNTYETVQVASTMGIEDYIQVIAYTHLESQIFKDTKNPFLYSTNEMMRKQLEMPGVWVGTQSKFNQISIDNGAWHLPIPISERGLLLEHDNPREGILFVGRWEPAKNPELFVELINQTQLPAKVMTSARSALKFEAALKKTGVPYEIKVGIIGQEKVDFMTSARLAFNPSIVESYGMAFHEQHIQLPTMVLENQRWTKNFNEDYFFTCNKKNMAEKAKELYDKYATAKSWYDSGSLMHAKALESGVFHKWNHCFNNFYCKQSNNDTAKICSETTVKYSDFTKEIGRTFIEDYLPIYGNSHKFRIIYTDNDTYLTKDPSFEPSEEDYALDLFQGL